MLMLIFLVFLVSLFLGVPVALCLAFTTVAGLMLHDTSLLVVVQRMFQGFNSFSLLAVPFFVLAGDLMNKCGITQRLIDFSYMLVGRIPGGLAHSNIAASMFLGGISGSAVADAAAIGSIMVPGMIKNGYNPGFSAAVTAAASTMGPIIPPSIVLIVYASITNVSVAELFLGSVLPGIILAVALIAYGLYYGHKHNLPAHEKPNLRKIGSSVRKGIWALLMPVILLGGILSGIFTPTEASIVTCVYSLIVGVFVYKEIKLSDVPRIVYTNMRSCSSIIILIGLANVFAFILTNERIPQKVATAILSMTTNRILVILLINLVLIFVGMFMESLAAILITFPVLLPVATAVGMNPVHFALMAILNLMIGLTTPPVGMCICTGAQIGGVSSWKAFKANMPFLITSLIVLMLVSFCEPITLWIPSLFA